MGSDAITWKLQRCARVANCIGSNVGKNRI
jgi:hypothetical protein